MAATALGVCVAHIVQILRACTVGARQLVTIAQQQDRSTKDPAEQTQLQGKATDPEIFWVSSVVSGLPTQTERGIRKSDPFYTADCPLSETFP